VSIALSPAGLNVRSVLDRAKTLGDPMLPMLTAKPDVAAAVAKLEERTRKGAAKSAPANSPRPSRKR
jgi:hypothetical protein